MQPCGTSLILSDLNFDCLYYLTRFLDFPSQINFARTCENFAEIMILRWKREWNAKEFTMPVYQPCCDLESYKYFLNAISFILEYIYLPGTTFDSFMELCKNMKFPSLKRLKIIAEYRSADVIRNNDFAYWKMLSKCPNLIDLKLENTLVKISRLKSIRKLKTLHLRRCILEYSNSNHLNELLQCKQLTKLHLIELEGIASLSPLSMVNLNVLQELCLMHAFFIISPCLVTDICSLASLKTLIVGYDNKTSKNSLAGHFKRLHAKLCHRICYFGISPKFISWPDSQLENIHLMDMCELRVLEFYWADLRMQEKMITSDNEMYSPKLEELILTYCNNISERCLLDMIKNCTCLKYIDLKECENLTENFIWEAANYLLLHNIRTLTINVKNSSLSTDINENPDFWQYKSFLKIIDKPRKVPDFYKDAYCCYAFKLVDLSKF